jgi:hypothetical protein
MKRRGGLAVFWLRFFLLISLGMATGLNLMKLPSFTIYVAMTAMPSALVSVANG